MADIKKAAAAAKPVAKAVAATKPAEAKVEEKKVEAKKAVEEKKAADLKSVDLYVKPEENKVYYVMNGDVTGDFDI